MTRYRDLHAEAALRQRPGVNATAARRRAFAQTTQTIAGCVGARLRTVIRDLEARLATVASQPDRARGGAAVPNDVRDSFAHGPCERRVDSGWQRPRGLFDRAMNPGCIECGLRTDERCGEARLPVAVDRVPHVLKRLACDAFDIRDLNSRRRVVRREQSPRELALDRDEREAVTEQIVQIAGEAQAFLVGGPHALLLVENTELLAHAVYVRSERPQLIAVLDAELPGEIAFGDARDTRADRAQGADYRERDR